MISLSSYRACYKYVEWSLGSAEGWCLGWADIVGGWYLGARSDMQPVWQSMKTYAAAAAPKMFTVWNAGQANTPQPPESTNALTLCQEFFSLKMLCFFSQRWSKANAQDRKSCLRKLKTQYPPLRMRNNLSKNGFVSVWLGRQWGQTGSQLKLLLRDMRQWGWGAVTPAPPQTTLLSTSRLHTCYSTAKA